MVANFSQVAKAEPVYATGLNRNTRHWHTRRSVRCAHVSPARRYFRAHGARYCIKAQVHACTNLLWSDLEEMAAVLSGFLRYTRPAGFPAGSGSTLPQQAPREKTDPGTATAGGSGRSSLFCIRAGAGENCGDYRRRRPAASERTNAAYSTPTGPRRHECRLTQGKGCACGSHGVGKNRSAPCR
jgi:hypothetical protein